MILADLIIKLKSVPMSVKLAMPLNDFYLKSLGSPTRLGQQVFPGRPKGGIRAVEALAHYAYRKAYAMRLRRDGKISEAEEHERQCARIHADFPAYAQWKHWTRSMGHLTLAWITTWRDPQGRKLVLE